MDFFGILAEPKNCNKKLICVNTKYSVYSRQNILFNFRPNEMFDLTRQGT